MFTDADRFQSELLSSTNAVVRIDPPRMMGSDVARRFPRWMEAGSSLGGKAVQPPAIWSVQFPFQPGPCTIATVQTVNFQFLRTHEPSLLQLAALAERYVFDDPNTALIKVRQLAETLAKAVAAEVGLPCDREQTFLDVERSLCDRGLLDQSLHQVMRTVRLSGNQAVHELSGDRREAFHQLKLVRQLAVWFHKTLTRNQAFKAGPFTAPPDPADELLARIRATREAESPKKKPRRKKKGT